MSTRHGKVFTATQSDNDGDFEAQDWALFFGVSLIWGASFLLMAEALEGFTPGVVTLGRVGFGALVMWGLRSVTGRRQRIELSDRMPVLLLGIVWVAIPFTLFPIAQQWVNSAVTGLLNGATPVLVALVSTLFLRVVPKGTQLIGLVIGFIGILLISLGSASEGSSQAKGVLLILLATLCYGFALNMASPLQAKYGGIVLMTNVLTVATLCTFPYAMYDLGSNTWQTTSVLALAVVGCVGTGLAYWIMSSLVGRVGSIRASFITYLIPVVSLLLGIVFRGDIVTELAIVGAPITIAGAFLASRRVT